MKKNLLLVGVCLLSLALVNCASRASSVAPVSVPAADYAGLSCTEARGLLAEKREQENALSRQQNRAATADAVGTFLVLLPVSSLFGGDKEGELAEVKGEVNALERKITSEC